MKTVVSSQAISILLSGPNWELSANWRHRFALWPMSTTCGVRCTTSSQWQKSRKENSDLALMLTFRDRQHLCAKNCNGENSSDKGFDVIRTLRRQLSQHFFASPVTPQSHFCEAVVAKKCSNLTRTDTCFKTGTAPPFFCKI